VSNRTFTDVKLVAEQVPETHRTLENDRTITTVELPGMVTVYLVIDGGRLPFTQLRGADVLEAIDRAGAQQKAAQEAQQQQTATTAPQQPAPEQQQPPATPALEQQQG